MAFIGAFFIDTYHIDYMCIDSFFTLLKLRIYLVVSRYASDEITDK